MDFCLLFLPSRLSCLKRKEQGAEAKKRIFIVAHKQTKLMILFFATPTSLFTFQ
jgi:hypothetical protein